MLVCEFFLRGCSWLPFTLAPPFGNAGRTTTLCAPGWGLCPHLTSWNIKGCSELLGLWAGQAPSGSLCSRGSHPKNTHWKPMCLESWKCTGATKSGSTILKLSSVGPRKQFVLSWPVKTKRCQGGWAACHRSPGLPLQLGCVALSPSFIPFHVSVYFEV